MCNSEECKKIGEDLLNYLKVMLSEEIADCKDNSKLGGLLAAGESWQHLILNHMGEYYE